MKAREVLDRKALRAALKSSFRWRGDAGTVAKYADRTRWLRDPDVLASLGPGLGDLIDGEPPTIVVAPHSSGYLLGPLVATYFSAGFVPASKEPQRLADSDWWLTERTPLDYRGRNLELAIHKYLITDADRVLIVDD
jgi:adenine phosphoribosyltransferase